MVVLRNRLAAVVATLACQCLRSGEEAALQVWEVWFDYDVRAGGRYKSGTLALNVMFRRNDQQRKGHHPRLGRSVDPALDVVHQLRTYMRVAGLEQDPRWP